MESDFADRLIERVRELGHPLCAGLDPHLARIPAPFRRGSMEPGDPETAEAMRAFCLAYLERLPGRVAIVKPQSAFFETLGWRGVEVLTGCVLRARELGLLVLLDAKRGDIGSTAEGYARGLLGPDAAVPADALTVNPYLGRDSLEPFVARACATRSGLFVLTRTSNPGARDLQDLAAPEEPLYTRVADLIDGLAKESVGAATGWSAVGAVVGATWPDEARRLRARLPRSPFLVPGYGAQGAPAEDAVAGFVPGPDGQLEGGIVASSRALLFPEGSETADVSRWEAGVDEALDRATSELGEAIRS